MKKAQHGKCCFCEAKGTHVAYGDVEHFRPKKGYRQNPSDDLGRPGYYWLAYHWPNLYFSCQICNQRHKRNLFPLIDPAQRAIDHDDDQENEEPLFLDPGHIDPKDHISFRHEVAFPVEDSATGNATINGLGLNRSEILEDRLKHLTTLNFIRVVANMDGPERENARAYLEKTTKDDAEYASMTRAFLADTVD